MASGTIRKLKRKTGYAYSITYDVGQRWDEDKQALVRRQKTERVPENTHKAAQALLARRLAELDRGAYRDDEGLTVAEFARRWLTTRDHVRPSTRESDEYVVQRLSRHLGSLQLGRVRPDHIAAWRTALTQQYAPRTVRLTLQVTRALFATAVKWGYLRTNPATLVPNPAPVKRPVDVFTREQLRALIEAAGDWAPLVRLAATTGLRLGEVLAAQWAYCDLEEGKYTVAHNLNRQRELVPPKTGLPRTVPLGPATLEALKRHKAIQAKYILQHPAYADQDLLFPQTAGQPWFHTSFRSAVWLPLCQKAGLGRRRFHDLRHTCASLLLEQGARIDEVQVILGHSSPSITLNVYAHLLPGATHEQVAKLDEGIG